MKRYTLEGAVWEGQGELPREDPEGELVLYAEANEIALKQIDEWNRHKVNVDALVQQLDALLNGGEARGRGLLELVAQVRGMVEGLTPPLNNKTFQFKK